MLMMMFVFSTARQAAVSVIHSGSRSELDTPVCLRRGVHAHNEADTCDTPRPQTTQVDISFIAKLHSTIKAKYCVYFTVDKCTDTWKLKMY